MLLLLPEEMTVVFSLVNYQGLFHILFQVVLQQTYHMYFHHWFQHIQLLVFLFLSNSNTLLYYFNIGMVIFADVLFGI